MHSVPRSAQVRHTQDRRRRRPPGPGILLFHPRRRQVRRLEDRRRMIVLDLYPRRTLAFAVMVLVLSAADALLTLVLLQHGAEEINPVMAYFLDKGPRAFLAAKYMLTAFSVFLIVLVSDVFIRPLQLFARDLLTVFAGLFAAAVAWQLLLACRYLR